MDQTEEITFLNTHPAEEGWGIFDCDGSENGRWQLCRDDAMDVFPSDDEAWVFVVEQAVAGSAYHQDALAFLEQNNPEEHHGILEFVAKSSAVRAAAPPARKTNVEFVTDLMNYSRHGALIQAFVIQSLAEYSRKVAASTPEACDTAMVSGHAWHGCAVELQEKLKAQGYA